ncbi:MAG: ABC transporter substrate-binding protein, partial [Acidimicrobiales bacterium]
EMTAADVKYSWERNASLTPLYPGAPKSQVSYYAGDFTGLQEVKVTGKYTCTAVFKEPFVPFETITLPWTTSGYIFPQAAVDKYGSLWGHHPIGTGPYEVVSYAPQSKMVLQKFPNYSGANEKLGAKNWYDEIVIDMVPLNALPKGEALTVGLQSGQVDFTYNLGALDVNRLNGQSGFRTYSPEAPLDYYFVAIDVQNPKLKDLRVRQAIRLALNIPEIIAANKLPLSTRQNSLLNKQLGVGYWAAAPTYTQDIKQAKSLLAAAGATNLNLELANPLLAETPGEPNQAMQVIKANLAQVGINVTIIETPPTSYVSKAGFSTLIYSYYGGAPDPFYQFEWFTCSQIGVWNYASWCNQTYSSDETKIATTTDTAQRDAIAIEMQKLIDDDCSYVWLSSAINFAASNSKTQAVFDRNGNPLLHYFYST